MGLHPSQLVRKIFCASTAVVGMCVLSRKQVPFDTVYSELPVNTEMKPHQLQEHTYVHICVDMHYVPVQACNTHISICTSVIECMIRARRDLFIGFLTSLAQYECRRIQHKGAMDQIRELLQPLTTCACVFRADTFIATRFLFLGRDPLFVFKGEPNAPHVEM